MGHEEFLESIDRIRKARTDAKSAAAKKPVKQARPKKNKVETLLKGMSEQDRLKLIAELEGSDK